MSQMITCVLAKCPWFSHCGGYGLDESAIIDNRRDEIAAIDNELTEVLLGKLIPFTPVFLCTLYYRPLIWYYFLWSLSG